MVDQLRQALDGWGTDSSEVMRLIQSANEAERAEILADAALMQGLRSALGRSELITALESLGVPLGERLTAAVDGWGCDAAQIRQMVENASAAEKAAVLADAALTNRLRSELGREDALYVLGQLDAPLVDRLNTTHLSTYVGDAVTEGRQIQGLVGVVGDADWDRAGIAHYGASTWNGGKRDAINGFVDGEGRVWIHKDRGNAGTMIHEAVHKYSDEAMIGVSQPLNEGVTEYFTRVVCAALTPPITGRGNYQSNYDCMVDLVALVGEATVASAYFDGDTDGLETAFVNAKSQSDWDDFVGHTKKNRWSDAAALCAP